MGEDDALPFPSSPSSDAGRTSDTFPDDNVATAERAWNTCLHMIHKHDATIFTDCKDEIEGLLILTGLFSAVVTGFVVESYKLLDPEPADAAVELLSQIFHQLNDSAPDTPSSATFHDRVQSSAVRLNILWFLSLALALIVALFGLMVKQWLREYIHSPTAGLRMQIRVRLSKYEGLINWQVQTILASLSFILQTAVILFLIGLTDFLWHLRRKVAVPVIALCSPFLFAFVFFTLAPLFSLHSPYRSPLPWFLRALGLALWHRSSKMLQHMWIDWDIQAVKTSSDDSKKMIDRRALSWVHTNSSDPRKTKAILTCVGTLDPAAIFDWLAAELNATPKIVLEHANNCTLSQLVDQWPLPGHAALDILYALLEVLPRFDGSLKDTFEFETLDAQKLVIHKAAMLSIFAAITKKIELLPETVLSRYLDIILVLVEKSLSTKAYTWTTNMPATDPSRCLSYSLNAAVSWYLERSYTLPSDALSKLIKWASFCQARSVTPSTYLSLHRRPNATRKKGFALSKLTEWASQWSHVTSSIYLSFHRCRNATGKEEVPDSQHAFEDAAAAVFQAAAIALSQKATNSESEINAVVGLLVKLSYNYGVQDQSPTWNVCAALIASISRSPDLLRPRMVSTVILSYLEDRGKSDTTGAPAEAEGLVCWSIFWAERAHLLGSGSDVVPESKDEDNFLKAFDVTFRVLKECRADLFKAARRREVATKIIVLLKARRVLAERRDPRLKQLPKFVSKVDGICDGLYSALEKIQWMNPERFIEEADNLREYIQQYEQDHCRPKLRQSIDSMAQRASGSDSRLGEATQSPSSASMSSVPGRRSYRGNLHADDVTMEGKLATEMTDHMHMPLLDIVPTENKAYTTAWLKNGRNVSQPGLLGVIRSYTTAWVKNILNIPQTPPTPILPTHQSSLSRPVTNMTHALQMEMTTTKKRSNGHEANTTDRPGYANQMAVNGDEPRSGDSEAAHGPSVRKRTRSA